MDWAIDVLKQVPALAVLAWLVHRGLENQKHVAEMFLERLRNRDEVLRQIEQNCHALQKDAIKAIVTNTAALAEIREALRRLA